MTDFESQIYRAIQLAEARDTSWKVVRVIVTPETWGMIAANLSKFSRHRPMHFHLDDEGPPPPIAEIRIRDVPIIANANAAEGFTLEQAQTVRFLA